MNKIFAVSLNKVIPWLLWWLLFHDGDSHFQFIHWTGRAPTGRSTKSFSLPYQSISILFWRDHLRWYDSVSESHAESDKTPDSLNGSFISRRIVELIVPPVLISPTSACMNALCLLRLERHSNCPQAVEVVAAASRDCPQAATVVSGGEHQLVIGDCLLMPPAVSAVTSSNRWPPTDAAGSVGSERWGGKQRLPADAAGSIGSDQSQAVHVHLHAPPIRRQCLPVYLGNLGLCNRNKCVILSDTYSSQQGK